MSKETLDHLIKKVDAERVSDPFSTKQYEKLTEYALKHGLLDCPQVWRVRMIFEALSASDMECWKYAINRDIPEPEATIEMSLMYSSIAKEYPTLEHVANYLDYLNPTVSQLQQSYAKYKNDFAQSQLLFDRLLAKLCLTKDWLAARALYESRLKTPHLQIEETLSSFSSFVSENFAQEYTLIMRSASKLLQGVQREQRYYEILEQAVAEDPHSPEPWIKYMVQLHQYSKQNSPYPSFLTVFYRSLFGGTQSKLGSTAWIDVWLTALKFLSAPDSHYFLEKQNMVALFAKCYPTLPQAYSELAWNLTTEQEIHSLRNHIIDRRIFEAGTVGCEILAKDLLTVQRVHQLETEFSQIFQDDILMTFKAFENNCTVIQFCIEMYGSSADPKTRRQAYNILCNLYDREIFVAALWLAVYNIFERVPDLDILYLVLLKIEANVSRFDDPRQVSTKIEHHFRLHIGNDSLGILYQRLNNLAKVVNSSVKTDAAMDLDMQVPLPHLDGKKRETIQDEEYEQKDDEYSFPERKRIKMESKHEVNEPVRNREQLRVKITPLVAGTNENDIKTFLDGYAKPISYAISSRSENIEENFAIVELSSEQELLSCLTRQFKTLLGASVDVKRVIGTTVWATNYPSSFGSDDINAMIFEITGIYPISLRLPSQKDNKERRFFYADFDDDATALFVRDKLSGSIFQGLKLKAEISDPDSKNTKDHAPASHQIHLHNLNFKKTTESTLFQYFQKWGEVANVNLPLSDGNKAKGFCNNGYAFITFSNETAASEALAREKAKIDDRVINISAVKAKRFIDKKAPSFDDQKTITIKNINETVSEAQLKKLIEEKVGPVIQISLKPSKKMALVEFLTARDAGKAGFELEGFSHEDRILHLGLKTDFFKEESATKVPSMMSPMLMRRKKR